MILKPRSTLIQAQTLPWLLSNPQIKLKIIRVSLQCYCNSWFFFHIGLTKANLDTLGSVITSFVNKSQNEGSFPSNLKCAGMTPLLCQNVELGY